MRSAPAYLDIPHIWNRGIVSMSLHPKSEPKPADSSDLLGSLVLEPHLPGLSPADLPPVTDLPDTADLPDWAALAGRLTGATDLRTQAAHMIEAGAPAEHVQAAVAQTEVYARALTELLRAVQATITDADAKAFDDLVIAQARVMSA